MDDPNCNDCASSSERLCPGLLPCGDDRWRRCDRRRHDEALALLPGSGLPQLEIDIDVRGLDLTRPLLLVEDPDIVWSTQVLRHLVSLRLLEGRPARYLSVPAWAGCGWQLMREDLTAAVFVAWALPDLAQAADAWIDALSQLVLGWVACGLPTAIATFGEWRPRTQVESLLIAEVRGRIP